MPLIDTLAYARRLREAGFTDEQAEGQAEALAAAMTDTLATKQDVRELATRIDSLEKHLDTRFVEFEKRVAIRLDERDRRIDSRFDEHDRRVDSRFDEQARSTASRFAEQDAYFKEQLADLERRMTMRLGGIMVAGIGVMSALVKVL
jgi:hypothetical protein